MPSIERNGGVMKKIPLADRGVAASAVLLAGTLAFLPWHYVNLGFVSVSSTGLGSPDWFLGFLAFLVALGIAGAVVLPRVTSWKLPTLPLELPRLTVVASMVVMALLVLKLVIHAQFLGFGCWLALFLGAALVAASIASARSVPAGS